MPNALLARYFQARGLFGDLDFSAMKETQPDELFAAWLHLPDGQRNEMDAEFRDIFDLSCEKGFRAIIDEAECSVTGQFWPGKDVYCFDIDYRDQRTLGDVKYIWDLNRLQFLPVLAMAVVFWSDKRALSALESAIVSWSEANPPFRGIGWNSGIELGLRAMSLILAASLCGDCFSAATADRLRAILAAHLYWLRRYPSRFSSANNHLIAEAMGVFLIAQALPDVAPMAQYSEETRATLEHEAKAQIFKDGVGAEQSPTYAAWAAEMILLASFVARANGRPFSKEVDDRLAAFGTYIAWLSDGNGRVPAIDDDDGGHMFAGLETMDDYYPASVALSIASFLGRRAFGAFPEKSNAIRDTVSAAQTLAAMHPKVCEFWKAVTALCVKPAQAEECGSFWITVPSGICR